MTKYQQAMARAVGLAEDGKRKNGRWAKGVNSADSAELDTTTYLKRCGAVLDYDAERGTTFADDVLTGALTLDDAYKSVMVALPPTVAVSASIKTRRYCVTAMPTRITIISMYVHPDNDLEAVTA